MKKLSDYQKIMQVIEAHGIKQTDAEIKMGVSPGLFNKMKNRKDGEGQMHPDNQEKFLRTFNVNPEWWKNEEGDMFLSSTELVKSNGEVKETFYKNLIEGNEEYSLIPRAVLKDYKIVPDKIIDVIIDSNRNEKHAITQSFQDQKDALINKHEQVIIGYEAKIKRLEAEIKELEIEREKLENERENLKRQVTLKLK